MESNFTNSQNYKYQKAKEKVQAIKGFYGNVLAYCIVIPVLTYINYRTTDFPWAIFPALGWGFGLLMNITHFSERIGKKERLKNSCKNHNLINQRSWILRNI